MILSIILAGNLFVYVMLFEGIHSFRVKMFKQSQGKNELFLENSLAPWSS